MNTRRSWTETKLFPHLLFFSSLRDTCSTSPSLSISVLYVCSTKTAVFLSLLVLFLCRLLARIPPLLPHQTLHCLVPPPAPEPHLSPNLLWKKKTQNNNNKPMPTSRSLCTSCVCVPHEKSGLNPVSALETPASVHTTSAPSRVKLRRGGGERPVINFSLLCFLPCFFCSDFSGGGNCSLETQHPVFCCFNYKGKRHRNYTTAPKRLLFSVCVRRRMRLCDSGDACICEFVCVCVCAPVGSKEVKLPGRQKSCWGLILSFTLSLLFSVVLCCLVVFVMTKEKKNNKNKLYICLLHIMYVSEVQNI